MWVSVWVCAWSAWVLISMRRRNESVLQRERRKGLMQPPLAPEKVVRRRAVQSRAVPLGCSQHRAQPPERPEMAVGTALLWLSAALLALPGVCGKWGPGGAEPRLRKRREERSLSPPSARR